MAIARQFYLQLYFDVMDDPMVAELPPTYQLGFIKLLMQALKSEEPGAILLPLPALTRALPWRKLERTEAFLEALEDSRLIGFRKADNAIIIAPRLLPQINSDESLPPRRNKKPSDSPERVKERVDKSRGKTMPVTDLDPVEQLLGAPIGTVTPPCNAPESPSETPHYSKESTEEQSKETTTTSRGGVTSSNPEEGKTVVVVSHSLRDSLIAEMVSPSVAEDLVRTIPEEQIRRQLEFWPFRKADEAPPNPGGMLRRAVEQDWAPTKSYQDAAAARLAAAAERERRKMIEAEREAKEARGAMEESLRLAWWEDQSEEVQLQIQEAARERMLPNALQKLMADELAGRRLGNLTLAALDAALKAEIIARMAREVGDGPNSSQGGAL